MAGINKEFDFESDANLENLLDDVVMPQKASKAAKAKPQKIRIMIDEVKGLNNYEVVAVNGKVWQIKRGVPVEVAPEVVHALELAQQTLIEQRKNPLTGEMDEVTRHFSAIPWRRV